MMKRVVSRGADGNDEALNVTPVREGFARQVQPSDGSSRNGLAASLTVSVIAQPS
jgi:hypothetical protein